MWHRIFWIGLIVAAIIYAACITPPIGTGYDDAAYVGLARAIGQGKGYVQPQVPANPPEAQYPPGWSLMLSLVWLVTPQFPTNAVLFKSVALICALVMAVLVYRWMRWRGEDDRSSCLVALLTLFNPLILGYATSAFSEMAFAASVILALWLVERYARVTKISWRAAIPPALAAVWVFYLRSFGVTLIIAAIIYLVLSNSWRRVIPFTVLALVGIVPWLARGFFLPKDAWTYTTQFFLKSMEQPELGVIGWGALVVRVILNLRAYLLAGLPGAIFPSQVPLTYVNLNETLRVGAPFLGSDLILTLIIVSVLASQIFLRRSLVDWFMVCYLGLGLLWNWEPTRFMIPLIPFLYYAILSLLKQIGAAIPLSQRRIALRLTLFMVGVYIAANVFVQAQAAWRVHQTPNPIMADWSARLRLFDWIKQNTATDAVLASLDDYQIYLYTNRAVIRDLNGEAVKKYKVDYIVLIPYGGVMVDGDLGRLRFDPLAINYPLAFTSVYVDQGAGINVFQVDQKALTQ